MVAQTGIVPVPSPCERHANHYTTGRLKLEGMLRFELNPQVYETCVLPIKLQTHLMSIHIDRIPTNVNVFLEFYSFFETHLYL
jgi:hypothetical protein